MQISQQPALPWSLTKAGLAWDPTLDWRYRHSHPDVPCLWNRADRRDNELVKRGLFGEGEGTVGR